MLSLRGFGGNQLLQYCDRFKKTVLLSLLLSLKLWEVALGAQQEAFTEERPEKPGVKKPSA